LSTVVLWLSRCVVVDRLFLEVEFRASNCAS
jgi:hypothetical protein